MGGSLREIVIIRRIVAAVVLLAFVGSFALLLLPGAQNENLTVRESKVAFAGTEMSAHEVIATSFQPSSPQTTAQSDPWYRFRNSGGDLVEIKHGTLAEGPPRDTHIIYKDVVAAASPTTRLPGEKKPTQTQVIPLVTNNRARTVDQEMAVRTSGFVWGRPSTWF